MSRGLVIIIQVTCGSVVKLKHAATGYDLHSHEISYGSGSGQQSVTGFQDTSDANSLWVVSGAKVSILPATNHANSEQMSQAASALSIWDCRCDATCLQEAECVQGTPIKSGTSVRLQHVATRRWLHSHHFPSPLSQNLEVPPFLSLI
jgi:dolichyl-phosphate-mannose--protein O-mannosyl transferase